MHSRTNPAAVCILDGARDRGRNVPCYIISSHFPGSLRLLKLLSRKTAPSPRISALFLLRKRVTFSSFEFPLSKPIAHHIYKVHCITRKDDLDGKTGFIKPEAESVEQEQRITKTEWLCSRHTRA
jgi:hypothetical protein